MKNKLFALVMGAAAFAIMAYAGYHTNKAKAELSEAILTIENAEALATGEGGSSERWQCWSSTKKDEGDVWMCGNPCFIKEHATGKGKTSWCYKN